MGLIVQFVGWVERSDTHRITEKSCTSCLIINYPASFMPDIARIVKCADPLRPEHHHQRHDHAG